MELLKIMAERRSVRKYTGEHIPDDKLTTVLQAGMLSASSKGLRPWEFIIVRDRDMLERMAGFRVGAADMLKDADAAIVVIGGHENADMWIEDCAIAMANMHLMADSLGIGSCWIQGRGRESAEGGSSEEYLRGLLGFPERFSLEAVLSLGMPNGHPAAHSLEELDMGKVHREKY